MAKESMDRKKSSGYAKSQQWFEIYEKEKHMKIRDFVYLDVDRLKSILAQVENGLTESKSHTSSHSKEGQLSGEGSVLGLLKAAGQTTFLWENQQTETKTLHDYIYNLIEDILQQNELLITIPGTVKEHDVVQRKFQNLMSDTSFLLVEGNVEINHYEYMRRLIENYNAIGKFSAWSTLQSLFPKESSISPQKKKEMLAELEKKTSLDKSLVEGLVRFIDVFYRNRIVLKMSPFSQQQAFRLVGNLRKEWLREDIDTIIHKYGTAPTAQWKMLAQVAAIPEKEQNPMQESSNSNSLESVFHNMFSATRGIESMALSIIYPEISVTPIAIYRD